MTDQPSTPGILGYFFAYGASACVFSAGVGVWLDGSVLGGMVTGIAIAPFILLWGMPLTALMLPVHFLCRRFTVQLVHVAVAGAAGAVGMLGFLAFDGGISTSSDDLRFTVIAVLAGGFSTAVGRAAAIPMVRWRNQGLLL